jgi:hypothetical protein
VLNRFAGVRLEPALAFGCDSEHGGEEVLEPAFAFSCNSEHGCGSTCSPRN